MSQSKKIVKYRKPFNINIGIIIFLIIFIYLVFNVFSYMTTTHISIYEVGPGTMAENNVYRGLVLRDEQVMNASVSGALNYYVKEASRIGYGDLIYSVDENGDVSQRINEANKDSTNLDDETLAAIEESISDFQTSYQAQSFYNVYTFKEDVDSTLNEALSLNALNDISEYAANAQNNNTFHQIYTDTPGIVVYYTDGFSDVTTDNFTSVMFDESSYIRNNLKNTSTVTAGNPVYTQINSENWNIIIPISHGLASELSMDDTIRLRFIKDGKTAYATYVIQTKEGQDYLILTLRNSMVRYAKDRFLEVELLLTEETGLKIPNSAITEKEFYTIPISYFMKGGDSDSEGLLVRRTNKDGNAATEFIIPTIYYETDSFYYIDSEDVSAGEHLVKSDSSEMYTIGTDTDALKGVYNVNKGYAVFKQIDILYQSREYTIVKTGTAYGISLYDHIALDSTKVNENDLLK